MRQGSLLTLVLALGSLATRGLALPAPTEVPILRPEAYTTSEDLEAIVVEAGEGTTMATIESNESGSGSSGLKEFDPNDCFLDKSRGPCRAVIDSWFFNVATKACQPFSWSGCGGNNNRFPEQALCEASCTKPEAPPAAETKNQTAESELPKIEPGVPAVPKATAQAPVTVSKHKLPDCPKFSGCSGKCVIIQDRSDRGCKKCLCGVTTEPEPKKALPSPTQVTSSNVTVSREAEVSVGSVSGIPEAEVVDETEAPIVGNPEENCVLPTRRGHCRAMMTRYHYDPKLKDCVIFHYGGCDGNPNNFVTKEKCLAYCKGQ